VRILALPAGAIAVGLLAAVPESRAEDRVWPGGTVVHIGDSFVDAGLRQALEPRFRAEGARYVVQSKNASYLGTWLSRAEPLRELHWRYKPSLFLVTLGANDTTAPPESRAQLVRWIVQQLGGVPCVWISTPLWRGAHHELMDVIRRESRPCRFFDSTSLEDRIPRQPDGIHPTSEGGAMWADAFWTWLQTQRDPSHGTWALKPDTAP
jgi:hypothetical protein